MSGVPVGFLVFSVVALIIGAPIALVLWVTRSTMEELGRDLDRDGDDPTGGLDEEP